MIGLHRVGDDYFDAFQRAIARRLESGPPPSPIEALEILAAAGHQMSHESELRSLAVGQPPSLSRISLLAWRSIDASLDLFGRAAIAGDIIGGRRAIEAACGFLLLVDGSKALPDL